MAIVAISALTASTTIATSDVLPGVIGSVTKKITAGNLRTQMFAFAATDPINTGSITAVGNSTVTGTLSGITTLTATGLVLSGSITGATSLALAGPVTGATTGAFSGAVSTGALSSTTGNFSSTLTVAAGGISVTSGGITITNGGLTVTAGGLTVNAGATTLAAAETISYANGNTFDGTNASTWNNALILTNSQGSPATGTNALIKFSGVGNVGSAFGVSQNAGGTGDFVWAAYNGSAFAQLLKLSTAGSIVFQTAASKIIPGATSVSLRNNADSADNLLIADAGTVTLRGKMVLPGITPALDITAGGTINIGAVGVVGQRATGYTNAWTGTPNRATAYDPSTVTLVQLAQRVKAIQDDLTVHGLIGV